MKDEGFDMTDAEQLVQRFVDQELSAEERVRFVARLGRDEALRQRAIDLQQLVIDVSGLPGATVPDRFVARVMERTAPARSLTSRLADAFWTPRDLRWNLAGATTRSTSEPMASHKNAWLQTPRSISATTARSLRRSPFQRRSTAAQMTTS